MSRDSVLAVRVSGRASIAQIRNPSSEVGQEPEVTAVTGYSVAVELAAPQHTVVVTGIRAEVTSRDDVQFEGVDRMTVKSADLIGSNDLVEATLHEPPGDTRPLDPPHLEALLDQDPPVVRPATGSPQRPVQFPLTLSPGRPGVVIFVAPITDDARLVTWNLLVDFTAGGIRDTFAAALTVTGNTGQHVFRPGRPPVAAPVQDLVPDHWHPGGPGSSKHLYERLVIDSHGSEAGVHIEIEPGDLDRYVEARRAGDLAAMSAELPGLTLYSPRIGENHVAAVGIDGTTYMIAFTSLDRLREFDAPGMDTEHAFAATFATLVRQWDGHSGLIIDSGTDLAMTLEPERFHHFQKVIPEIITKQMEDRAQRVRGRERRAPDDDYQAPDDRGFIAARMLENYEECVNQLRDLTVWLPVRGSQQRYLVAQRGGGKYVRAYTRKGAINLIASAEVDPEQARPHRFADLIRRWKSPDVGLVINPDSDTEFRIPANVIPDLWRETR